MGFSPESLADLFERNGHDAVIRGTDDVSILCPLCPPEDPDRKFKCYVHPYKEMFHCFRCGNSGSIRRLLREMGIKSEETSLSLEQMRDRIVRARVNSKFGVWRSGLPRRMKTTALPEGYAPLADAPRPSTLAAKALRWLKDRGVDLDQCREWKLGTCADGEYAGQIVMPIMDAEGNVVTFQARRFIGCVNPKSKNPDVGARTASKTDVLYGVHKVVAGRPLVLVEGPFDVMALDKAFEKYNLYQRALGLMGHLISRVQRHLLMSLVPSSVHVMMDADASREGLLMARELAGWLPCNVYWVKLEAEEGDPDDLDEGTLFAKLVTATKANPKADWTIS